MKNMDMPQMNIAFSTKAASAVQRGERGIVLLVLRDTPPLINPSAVFDESDIPAGISEENKEYIKMALIGNETKPKKVVCFFIGEEDEIDAALEWGQRNKADYIAMPTAETDGLTDAIALWVKEQKKQNNMIKAVLSNCEADSEYVINYVGENTKIGSKTYSAEQMTPRIAGIICGTSLEHSITYATVPEAEDCERKTKQEADFAVGAGKLFCIWDGEKVKLSRGVNSLTSVTAEKGETFKKIKNIEVMNMIESDLRTLCQDNYIGKFGNSYSNRCLLLSAIGDYLSAYVSEGIVEKAEADFDTEAIKAQMTKDKIDFSEMTDEQIRQTDTGTNVFIAITLRLRDAIEDITISVTV
ncbi:MAG: phage tail sheath C-terminal domain-containing protein [Acutalibacteraceae bacterium]